MYISTVILQWILNLYFLLFNVNASNLILLMYDSVQSIDSQTYNFVVQYFGRVKNEILESSTPRC